VVPYFGYARQDRRSAPGEPVGARVVADALAASGAHRLIVIDPHTAALEAMCGIPVEMLTADTRLPQWALDRSWRIGHDPHLQAEQWPDQAGIPIRPPPGDRPQARVVAALPGSVWLSSRTSSRPTVS
jgi:hypothetical protein